MSNPLSLGADFFTQPSRPQNISFNSPKASPQQQFVFNSPQQTIEIISSSIQFLDTLENTHDPHSEIERIEPNNKSKKTRQINKKPKNTDKKVNGYQKQTKFFEKNKFLKSIKDSVETTNTKVMYNQKRHSTEDLLTRQQKQKLEQVVCIKKFQQVKDKLKINLKSKSQKLKPGKKPINEVLEQKVIEYVKQLSESKSMFTSSDIRKKALEYSTDPDFRASKGWYERFRVRNSHIFNYQSKREKKSKQ